MFRPLRIVIIGRNLAEVKENMLAFIAELDGKIPQPTVESQATGFDAAAHGYPTPAQDNPFGPPPPVPNDWQEYKPTAALPPTSPVVTNNVDTRGFQYDERIHSATAARNKDGSWRYRRNVDQPTIDRIEQELKLGQPAAQSTAPTPQPVAPPTPQVAQAPIAPPVVASPVAPTVAPLSVVPPLQAAPPVAAPMPQQPALPAAFTVESFASNLIMAMASLVREGKLTQIYVQQLKDHFGGEIWQWTPEQINEVFEQFVSAGIVARV